MTCHIVAAKFGWLEIISYITSVIIDMKNISLSLQYNGGFLKKNYDIMLLKMKYQSSLFVCDHSRTAQSVLYKWYDICTNWKMITSFAIICLPRTGLHSVGSVFYDLMWKLYKLARSWSLVGFSGIINSFLCRFLSTWPGFNELQIPILLMSVSLPKETLQFQLHRVFQEKKRNETKWDLFETLIRK